MKFRVERDSFADAVAWAARSLSTRPAMPILAGLLLTVEGSTLTLSGFDLEASTEVELDVAAADDGAALVSGRLLAEISKALPAHPIDLALDGSRLAISCGSSKFSLPTMPIEDYPRLPLMPSSAGTVDAHEFATAVAQVAIAAGKDDTLPMLTGVRLEIAGDKLTLAATDRYRLAVRELSWTPERPDTADVAVLVPARTLADAAKSLAGSEKLTISLSAGGAGEGIIGFSGSDGGRASRATTRLLDAAFPAYQSIVPNDWASSAEVDVDELTHVVRRVALVANRNAPVRLEFADNVLSLSAGGDEEGRAEEQMEVVFEGEPISTAFNPQFLLDGLGALSTEQARMLFTSATKPAVLRPHGDGASEGGPDGASEGGSAARPSGAYTYVTMPVRMPN